MILTKFVNVEKETTIKKENESLHKKERELIPREEWDEMATKNQLLIRKVAHNFSNTGVQHDDLFGIAQLGFVRALQTFDRSKGIMFSTYSYIIMSQEILAYLRKEKKIVSSLLTEKALERFTEADTNASLEMYLYNEPEKSVEDEVVENELERELILLMKDLTTEERFIIEHRYGINKKKNLNQTEIGETLEISQPTVSRIERVALKKLRIKLINNKDLAEYLLGLH